MATPWYYQLYWRMESWLASQTRKTLNRNSNFFGKMLAGRLQSRASEKLKPLAVESHQAAFHLRNKPWHENKPF